MLGPYVGVKVEIRRKRRRSSDDQYASQRSNLKIGHVMIELISSMSWRRRRWAIHHVSLQDINIMENEEMLDLPKKMSLSHRSMGEQGASHFSSEIMDMWRHRGRRIFPYEYGGAIWMSSPSKCNQERRSILRWTRSSSSSSSGTCPRQMYDLERLSLLPVS